MPLITTSWDDGHELDLKLAGLLDKYNLKATFYIPRSNSERTVMNEQQIRMLSNEFEIGGHTLNHTRLKGLSKQKLGEEIGGSYQWLGNVTGGVPSSFCFPGGVYDSKSIKAVYANGYRLIRTTELLSIKEINEDGLLPTTLQMHEHSRFTYLKHLSKRKRWNNLIQWMKAQSASELLKLTSYYLQQAELYNGCFHLWGHSWEIEEFQLWNKLEQIFRLLSEQHQFSFIENRHLLHYNAITA